VLEYRAALAAAFDRLGATPDARLATEALGQEAAARPAPSRVAGRCHRHQPRPAQPPWRHRWGRDRASPWRHTAACGTSQRVLIAEPGGAQSGMLSQQPLQHRKVAPCGSPRPPPPPAAPRCRWSPRRASPTARLADRHPQRSVPLTFRGPWDGGRRIPRPRAPHDQTAPRLTTNCNTPVTPAPFVAHHSPLLCRRSEFSFLGGRGRTHRARELVRDGYDVSSTLPWLSSRISACRSGKAWWTMLTNCLACSALWPPTYQATADAVLPTPGVIDCSLIPDPWRGQRLNI
jgi:hypothetical protein